MLIQHAETDLKEDAPMTRDASAAEVKPEGLDTAEAERRLAEYGPNELVEKHISPVMKFLGYFWGPIPWMIEVAAILSIVVHHWEDFYIITALLVLNAVVGFWQEFKADNAIALLKQRLALRARVRRDGKWAVLPAKELVPGDLVRVRLGDVVPADLSLYSGDYLIVDESALTGESLPVEKHTDDTAYSGSVIRQGEMEAVVTATGMKTFFGRTAQLVSSTENRSHFQKTIIKIGNYLIVLAFVLVAVIFAAAMLRHSSMLTTLQFALILTVAAIPAALPAVLSVTMAVGAARLAKKEAIVSRLVAIEELAGMDILCSDKTGTITENKLTVGDILPFGDASEDDVLLFAALASREENQDPIDSAVIGTVGKNNALKERFEGFIQNNFTPFDPVSKRTVADVTGPEGKRCKVAKGAPQALFGLVEEDEKLTETINEKVDALAENGYRALGVAAAFPNDDGEKENWRYIGLLSLFDPPREDSAETIKTAGDMQVDVKMITGDHLAIAKETARRVGLGDNILTAESSAESEGDGNQTDLESADGFAQVFPEHKYRLVEQLQEGDHIVGMTGDGVNDAPALKKADAGIAVAGATDAARSAADIVLTKPGLSVIIDAIKESRRIFQRMNSYAIYRITETIRVLFFITISILAFNFYPVTAIMIVMLALLNDAPIMAIAYDNVKYSPEPERWDMRIVLGMATFLGIIGVVFSFLILYIGRDVLHLSPGMLQSLIFLKLAVAGHLTIFLARTRGPFWTIKPAGTLFWTALATKVLATLAVVYGWYMAPIGWRLALYVWGFALLAFAFTDYLKLLVYDLLDYSARKQPQ